MTACDNEAHGCTLTLHTPGVYRTSSINLTSHLTLDIAPGATLQGTETNADNCAPPAPGHNCSANGVWPVLPWPSFPSTPAGSPGGGASAAMAALIRTYNATDLAITGGGTIDGGGPWWWCTRFKSALLPGGASNKANAKALAGIKAIYGCADRVAAGTVPQLHYVPPRFFHFVESTELTIQNITIQNSPYWTVHFQFSSNILFEGNTIFNLNNATFETPNGDGVDIDSSRSVLVRNNIVDVGDDALCVKSGADWLGRRSGGCNAEGVCVGRPTANVLWLDNEVRNGHGLSPLGRMQQGACTTSPTETSF